MNRGSISNAVVDGMIIKQLNSFVYLGRIVYVVKNTAAVTSRSVNKEELEGMMWDRN